MSQAPGVTFLNLSSEATTSPASAPPCAVLDEHEQWFNENVHAHDQKLKSYLRSSFPSVSDVEDIVQESYLRIWRRQLVDPIRSSKTFLFQIAKRLAIDLIRHHRAAPFDSVTETVTRSVIEDKLGAAAVAVENEELDMLYQAIKSLPQRTQEILILRKIQRLSQKEIAAQLGISERVVASQACRGLAKCSEYFAKRRMRRTDPT
jgi:RNA polymerase sigma factor (sigma-70 family)